MYPFKTAAIVLDIFERHSLLPGDLTTNEDKLAQLEKVKRLVNESVQPIDKS